MNSTIKYLLERILFPPIQFNSKRFIGSITGKTILITGASYGIGEALAYKLAIPCVHLILVARTEEKLFSIKNELESNNIKVDVFAIDLSNKESVEKLIQSLKLLKLGVDIFISNAGKSICRPLIESLDRHHDFTRLMSVNYIGPVQLLISLIPILTKKKGHFINISAINVLLPPVPYWAAYQSSKVAMDQMVRSSMTEMRIQGIEVSSIYLPLVKTRMIEPSLTYKNAPAMNVDYVASIVCKTLYTKCKRYVPWWMFIIIVPATLFRSLWERSCLIYLKNRNQKK